VQAVQVAHAVYESTLLFPPQRETFFVVLGVPDTDALEEAHERITRKGIGSAMFFEPDHAFGHTAFACEPVTTTSKRKVFYPYRTLGEQHAEVA
jgi:hypothetical protein